MSEGSSSAEKSAKKIRDRMEETFARYEPREETPQLPHITEETPRTVETAVAPQEAGRARQIETGIAGLDALTEGGLPSNSLILVLGEPGSHYDTFVRQVLYNHGCRQGKVAYYVAECPSEDVCQQMETFGWDLQQSMARGNWVFVNLRTHDLEEYAMLAPKTTSEGSSLPLTESLNGLKTDLLNKTREKCWTTVELSHLLHQYELIDILNLVIYWRRAIRTCEGIHFALLPLGVHPENAVNALAHAADGVLEFRIQEKPRSFEQTIALRKLMGLRRPLKIPFRVGENGIVFETVARIG